MMATEEAGTGWTVGDQVEVMLAVLRHDHLDPKASVEKKNSALYDNTNLDMLLWLSKKDQIAFTQVINEIDKITHLGVKVLKEAVNRRAATKGTEEHIEDAPGQAPEEEVSPEIKQKALKILMQDDPIESIATACNGIVIGTVAKRDAKKLICGIAVQDVRQSAGLHFKANGESGSGKTLLFIAFAHHLPPEIVVFGGTSALAAVYHEEGPRLFRVLDDYRAGNDTLDDVMKRTSSSFHKEYIHRTVKNMEPLTLRVGAEQTWAVTSVDSSQDIQNLNRQIPINVDDSDDLTREVNRQTIQRYGKGDLQLPEDETVLVCREIWRILRAEGYINVRVPFWHRIEWLSTRNRRDLSIFMDMLVAHTAMFRYQREKDADGFYLATKADFTAAKELFGGGNDAEELVHRLTKKERQMADILSKNPGGLTRDELAEHMNITPNRVSQLANGEKGKGGLSQKLSGFTTTEVTDHIELPDGTSRSIRKTLYNLTGYDPLTGVDALVVLKPDEPSKDGKDGVSSEVRIPAVSRSTSVEEEEFSSKESKEEIGIETGDGKDLSDSVENHPIPLPGEENPYSTTETASLDPKPVLTAGLPHPYSAYASSADSGQESLPQACGGFSDEYRDQVLVCRKILNALIVGEDITDPLRFSQICGIPVCTVAQHAANYLIKDYHFIDQKKAGEILVTLGRASWWPPREMSPLVEIPAGNESENVADTPRNVEENIPHRFDVIYRPGGAALEYSAWACNLVQSGKGGKVPKTCSHDCLYCYNKPGTGPGPVLKSDVLNRFKRDLQKLKKVIRPGERLEFCFVGDPYDPALPEGIFRQFLEACKDVGIPFQVLTKNGPGATKDFDLYGPDDLFGVTLTGCDEWEPGAAKNADRVAALQEAHKRGVKTWVSFEPVIDTQKTLDLIKLVDPFVNDIKIGKLNSKWFHPQEVKDLDRETDWSKFHDDAVALCLSLGRVEGQNFMIKDDLKAAARAA